MSHCDFFSQHFDFFLKGHYKKKGHLSFVFLMGAANTLLYVFPLYFMYHLCFWVNTFLERCTSTIRGCCSTPHSHGTAPAHLIKTTTRGGLRLSANACTEA